MILPLQITFRDMEPSPALEARIREEADKLERFFDDIIACRIAVSIDGAARPRTRTLHLRIELSLPGADIVVSSTKHDAKPHERTDAVIRRTFSAATRKLEDHARQLRGDTKLHEVPDHGRIIKLMRKSGYGFIESADGREIYFHKNSVVDGAFPKLDVGMEVRFVARDDESVRSPQASTVKPIGKHHLPDVEAL